MDEKQMVKKSAFKLVAAMMVFSLLSGCLGSGDTLSNYNPTPATVKEVKENPSKISAQATPHPTTYGFTPDGVNWNPDHTALTYDMKDPFSVVEGFVEAIAANDYKAADKFMTPYFKEKHFIESEFELQYFVDNLHHEWFEKSAGKKVTIQQATTDKDEFFIKAGVIDRIILSNENGQSLVDEWID